MEDNKKVVLLKELTSEIPLFGEEVRGVARITPQKNGFLLSLSIINLPRAVNGEYLLLHYDNQLKEYGTPSIDGGKFFLSTNGGSLCLILLTDGKIIPVIFGKLSPDGVNWESLVEIAEKYYKIKDSQTDEKPVLVEEETYDDEAVATENYFEYDEVKNEQNYSDGIFAGAEYYADEEKETVGATDDRTYEDGFGKENDYRFYEKIEKDLNPVFEKYPPEKGLAQMVHNSKWAKVSGENGKYYVVGIISEKNLPVYICYGIPGKYGIKPAEIKGYSSFIPISQFDLKGDGYWVMYQRATSGEIIK